MAYDTISAHDVSVKILRRFFAEHSCPHHKISKKRRAVRHVAFGFSGPPCFFVSASFETHPLKSIVCLEGTLLKTQDYGCSFQEELSHSLAQAGHIML